MKRTFQPSKIKRARNHGFLKRMSTKQGRRIINRRRAKGRVRLSAWWSKHSDTRWYFSKVCPLQYTFTKTDRILKRREFIALAKSGRRVQSECFIAVFTPGRRGRSRLGITVTKKVGGAVKRNRIKRLVREFFRLNRQLLAGDWDINIIARNHIAGISTEKAYQSLQHIFDRISRYEDAQ